MKNKDGFVNILNFFQKQRAGDPGDPDYDAGFCHSLAEGASANEASIWQLDSEGRLHMVYGTNVAAGKVLDITLREGEGISGAAALSRKTIAVVDASTHPQHDRRVDEVVGYPTRAMISAPIIFGDILYGVVNILNPVSGTVFETEWQERLSAAAVMYGAALAAAGRLVPYDVSQEREGVKKRKTTAPKKGMTIVVGVSRAVQEALHLCLKAGKTNMPVVVTGETGTGKELAARRIHEASDRAGRPFVDVNCAALTETLLESELFGHVMGAFTGANRDRKGKFSAASGGTLFLDEIGDMSPTCQAKVLRALQEKRITPVGSDKAIDSDARVIVATNQDLWGQVERGKFRKDLYYRLCGIEIHMPPLRERPEDIPLLATYILNKAVAEYREHNPSYRPPTISDESIEMLRAFNWPGNVRQLEQAINAAIAICEGDEIQPGDFPAWLHTAIKPDLDRPVDKTTTSQLLSQLPKSFEIGRYTYEEVLRYISALDANRLRGTDRYNLSAAARQLDIPRKTFVYRLRKMRIIE